MIRGLPASIMLHVCVIALGTATAPFVARNDGPPPVIVPIELVTASAITDIAPVIEPDEPDTEEVIPPPPEPDLEEYLPDIDTLPEEDPLPDEEPVEDTAPEPAEITPPPPEPEPEPEEPEPEIIPDPDAEEPEPEPEEKPEDKTPPPPPPDPLADLLADAEDRLKDARTQRAPGRPTQPEERELTNEQPARRRGAGNRQAAVASFQSIIATQMKGCWADVVDLPNHERLVVTLRVRLKSDGTLEREPELVDPPRAPIGDRYMQVAIDRALNATRRCAPYQLPEEDYEIWSVLSFAIGPEAF